MYSLGGNTRKEIVGQSNCMCKTMRELKKKYCLFGKQWVLWHHSSIELTIGRSGIKISGSGELLILSNSYSVD